MLSLVQQSCVVLGSRSYNTTTMLSANCILPGGSTGSRSTSKCLQVVGRIPFLGDVGLRSSSSRWLSAGDCSHLLQATPGSLLNGLLDRQFTTCLFSLQISSFGEDLAQLRAHMIRSGPPRTTSLLMSSEVTDEEP